MRLSFYFFNRSNLNFSVKIFTYFLKIIYHTYVRFIKINLNWLLLLTILYSRFYRFAIVEIRIKLNFRKIDILGEIIKPRPPPLLLLLFLKSVKKKKILQNQPLNLPYTRLNSQRSAPSATCCFSPSEGTNNSNLFSRHEFHPISKRCRHHHVSREKQN